MQAVFFSKFAKFIEWPQENKESFVITIIDENPFENQLETLYEGKQINSKPVKIRYAKKLEELDGSDIVYITVTNPLFAKEIIAYSQANSILSISDQRGFAQRGGIIQLSFVARKAHLVINHEASQASGIKISSSLLAIAAQVIQKDKK
ncbi:MAG TPA: YfiR family protein [Sulfurimonas sp.]